MCRCEIPVQIQSKPVALRFQKGATKRQRQAVFSGAEQEQAAVVKIEWQVEHLHILHLPIDRSPEDDLIFQVD